MSNLGCLYRTDGRYRLMASVSAVRVDQRDPTPLHQQLAAILRAQIEAGDYDETGMLPSEGQLQQEHEVSRGTVRRALATLADEGLVFTIAARGTFVRRPD
jgi:GntR family transcriptional regulator